MRKLQLTTLAIFLTLGTMSLIDDRPAWAGPTLFGIRGGLTDDVDTVFFGGHVAIHPSGVRRLRIEPSFELGIGDDIDIFTLRANANFKYMFPVTRQFAVYPLLGPYLYYVNFDDCDDRVFDCDDTEFGINLGAGFEFSGFALEISAGLPDYPDITFTLAFTFW